MHGKRAFELASLGASFGCAHNKGVLGCCYVFGRGVAKDEARGFEFGRESAAAGSRIGLCLVGLCYDAGWGVAADRKLALRSIRAAMPLFGDDDYDDENDGDVDSDWFEGLADE